MKEPRLTCPSLWWMRNQSCQVLSNIEEDSSSIYHSTFVRSTAGMRNSLTFTRPVQAYAMLKSTSGMCHFYTRRQRSCNIINKP